jgi:hypothetical protein
MQTTDTRTRHPAEASLPFPAAHPQASPKWMARTGRILQGFLALFLLFDGGARVVGFAPYVEGTVQAGYPASFGVGIGLTLIVATLLYLAPRTAVLGAILLTGYLGGATATHLRLQVSFVFPLAFGVLVWGALFLLDARIRGLLPLRR